MHTERQSRKHAIVQYNPYLCSVQCVRWGCAAGNLVPQHERIDFFRGVKGHFTEMLRFTESVSILGEISRAAFVRVNCTGLVSPGNQLDYILTC